jgi:hypothetical protein
MSVQVVRPSARIVAVMTAAIGSLFLAGFLIVAFSDPVTVIAALLVVCAMIAVLRFPILPLGFLLFAVPFHHAIIVALGYKAHVGVGALTYWKDALILALFVRAVVGRFWSDRRLLPWKMSDSVLIVYVLVWVLIAVLSPPRAGVGSDLARYVEGPLILLTITFLRPTRKQVWLLATALIAAAAIIGGAAVIEWLGPRANFQSWYGPAPPASGEPFKLAGGGYRAGSFIYDPLIFAFYIAGATPFALAATFVRTRWRTAAVFGALACGAGVVVAFSRSGYLGGGFGVLAATAFAVRRPAIRLSLIGLIILISGATYLYYFTAGSESLNRSGSDRAHSAALKRDLDLVTARPFGYGLATTDRSNYVTPGPGQLGYTESAYMATAIGGGLPGLILYLVVLFMTMMRVRTARRSAIRAGDRTGTVLAAGALGAMLAVMVAGLFVGIHELLIEVMLWGTPGLALAWASSRQRELRTTSA